ncbi:MAG: hypothetical protein ABIQ01_12775 [Pseudolysinimonas sp.]
MTNAPDTGAERLAEYARLFDDAYLSRERTPDGMRWRLSAKEGIDRRAKRLAKRENACCSFMTNTVTVVGDEVIWEASTIDDPAARDVLDMFYDLPLHRSTNVAEMHHLFTERIGVPIVFRDGVGHREATAQEVTTGRKKRSAGAQTV